MIQVHKINLLFGDSDEIVRDKTGWLNMKIDFVFQCIIFFADRQGNIKQSSSLVRDANS